MDLRERRMLQSAVEPQNPSIPPVSMARIRKDPQRWLTELRGKVTSISVISSPIFTAGGEAGNNVIPHFTCFLIDSNGEIHDLAESRDERLLEDDGEWLAGELGLELDRRF
ncbi:MAG: hypothetical protein AAGF11_55905 [Myxococcota bacterium]